MIEVYTDGASRGNPGPSGIGVLIKVPGGRSEEYAIASGEATNHEAEFLAVLEALKICLKKGYRSISLRTDSQIVDRALNRHYVKNERFQQLLNEIVRLEEHFDLIFVKWVPSAQNKKADQLARSAIHAEHKHEKGCRD
ncbi:ribonuclease HI family protein [Camelliibacillus cellulosilyticus]|uniref:Ribonuclease HI family protein n=1 Tax=Camelliibacillus cellulosilyticus TaxID=2174486 RepID=A0ABV9GK11_9BACL